MDHCPEHSAHDRAISEHDSRLEAHGKQIDKLNESIATLTEIERQNQALMDKADERIAALESVPASRWNKATDCTLTVLLGIVIGVMASHLGF